MSDYGQLNSDNEIKREHRWLGEKKKSHYIPGWYDPHTDLDAEVTHLGKPQGMKIRNVLPFRRWALDARGATMNQADFERAYQLYLADGFGIAERGDFHLEHIPNVLVFVRAKMDHTGNFVDFDFHDDGAVIKQQRFTQDGDVAPEFLAKQQELAEDAGGMKALSRLAASGAISPEEFVKQAAAILGTEAPAAINEPVTEKPHIGRKKGYRLSEEQRAAAVARLAAGRAAKAARLQVSETPKPPDEAA